MFLEKLCYSNKIRFWTVEEGNCKNLNKTTKIKHNALIVLPITNMKIK